MEDNNSSATLYNSNLEDNQTNSTFIWFAYKLKNLNECKELSKSLFNIDRKLARRIIAVSEYSIQ